MTETALDPKDPDLLVKIGQILDRTIRGEKPNKLLLFLICLSSVTDNPLSGVVKGLSSSGKSTLVKSVLEIFRKVGDVMEFSRMTPAYLDNLAKKTDGKLNLQGKILFVEELRGIQNAQAPKLIISEGRLRLGTVEKGKPIEIETIGTPTIITTTTLAVLDDPEFENRIIPLQIDESEEQTREVLAFEAEQYEDPSDKTESESPIVELLKELQPRKIAIPFANELSARYPTRNLVARRDFRKLMNLIGVSAYLHQQQRLHAKKGTDLVIVADSKDFQNVSKIARGALQESLHGMSEKEQELLEAVKGGLVIVSELVKHLRPKIRKGEQWIRDHLKRLAEEGYVERDDELPEDMKQTHRNARSFWKWTGLDAESLWKHFEGYQGPGINEWADKNGYELTDPFSLGNSWTAEQAKTGNLEDSELIMRPSLELGHKNRQDSQFGHVQNLNRVQEFPKPDAYRHDSRVVSTKDLCLTCWVIKRYERLGFRQAGPPINSLCEDCGNQADFRVAIQSMEERVDA